MKTVYLIRHAKSDWDIDGQEDIDRPLSKRGYSDAHKMSSIIQNKGILPDVIITSPAVRAISTALIFARNLKYDFSKIVINVNLYDTSAYQYAAVIAGIDSKFSSIFLFGHNPTISNFAYNLNPLFAEELTTCAIAGITKKAVTWEQFISAKTENMYYDFPKKVL